MTTVYLDHNATTPERPEVAALRAELSERGLGNPSSLHAAGRAARQCIDEARDRVARALGVGEEEVVFTSGGTESNNLALLGAVRAARRGGRPTGLVTTAVEHSAVLGPAEQLEREGSAVRLLPVGPDGRVDPDRVLEAVSAGGVGLVSVQATNNEIGVRQPLHEVGALLADADERPLLHTDAVQAFGRSPLDLRAWGIDLASFAAHKLGGPLGVGVLVRRTGVELEPLLFGGGQEAGLRPGTENPLAFACAGLAFELAAAEREAFEQRLRALDEELWSALHAALPRARLLGPPLGHDARQPGTLNVWIPDLDGKVLVTRLDLGGLQVSAGSACASGSLEPSHVLRALGFDDEAARAGVRLALGRCTTSSIARAAVDILRKTLGGGDATSHIEAH